jgi:hypothetical protein
MIVIDDALLLVVLGDQDDSRVAPIVQSAGLGGVFTTGLWYLRLARALARPGSGVHTRAFMRLDDDRRSRVRAGLGELPEEIGLITMRRLVPVMSVLPGGLNLLASEALAAAVVLDARIVLTTRSPPLMSAAAAVGMSVDVVDLG